MHFEFDGEQVMVRDSARRFLAGQATVDLKIAADEGPDGFDRKVWSDIAELGWLSFAAARDPAEITYLGILADEIGRASFASPFQGCVRASILLARAGAPQAVLDSIGAGGRIAGIVRSDTAAGRFALKDGLLTGEAALVEWGNSLDLLVVPIAAGEKVCVVVVDLAKNGVARSSVETFDNARAASISCQGVAIGDQDIFELPAARFREALAISDLLLASEAVGGAFGALDLTVAYVKERHQFGHPIAAFQAVRHGLADVRGLAEGAWLAVWDGLSTAASGGAVEGKAAVASWAAKRAFQDAALKGSQYHGGMGHVVESHMQFFYRRAGTFHGRMPSEWSILGKIADSYVTPNLTPRETGVVG